MNGKVEKIELLGYDILIYLPLEYEDSPALYKVVYVNGEDEIEEIIALLEKSGSLMKFIMVSICSKNWNGDFTPWEAPVLGKKQEAFTGGAYKYINFLVNDLKPYVDEKYKTKKAPCDTTLLGYSLGGLTALYALYKVDCFGNIGSISGSLWYDGFIEFMEKNSPINPEAKVYLSLGKGESRSRNMRMAKVNLCTEKAAEILTKSLGKDKVFLEWNEGGHFNDVSERFKKAILWLLK